MIDQPHIANELPNLTPENAPQRAALLIDAQMEKLASRDVLRHFARIEQNRPNPDMLSIYIDQGDLRDYVGRYIDGCESSEKCDVKTLSLWNQLHEDILTLICNAKDSTEEGVMRKTKDSEFGGSGIEKSLIFEVPFNEATARNLAKYNVEPRSEDFILSESERGLPYQWSISQKLDDKIQHNKFEAALCIGTACDDMRALIRARDCKLQHVQDRLRAYAANGFKTPAPVTEIDKKIDKAFIRVSMLTYYRFISKDELKSTMWREFQIPGLNHYIKLAEEQWPADKKFTFKEVAEYLELRDVQLIRLIENTQIGGDQDGAFNIYAVAKLAHILADDPNMRKTLMSKITDVQLGALGKTSDQDRKLQ